MWDRWLIISVGGAISLRIGYLGWRWGTRGDWLAGAGGFVLALIAVGVPLFLAVLGPATGR